MAMSSVKNCISILKEYHDRRRKQFNIDEPKYSCKTHEVKRFSVVCTYNNLNTEGIGSSKSEAKHVAASRMLLLLGVSNARAEISLGSTFEYPYQSSLHSDCIQSFSTSIESKNLSRDFLQKYSDSCTFDHAYPPNASDLELCFSDVNFGMRLQGSPKSATLSSRRDREMHSTECFEKVTQELGFKFCCKQLEVDTPSTYVILLKINFNYMVIGGLGGTLEEAVEKACKNGLDAFRLYMK